MNTKTTHRRPTRRAFTLVELMIVIVIIALLVSILAPAVSRAVQMSHLARTKSRINDLSQAIETFKLDNRFYPGQTTATGKDHITGSGAFVNKGSEFLARILLTTENPALPVFATAALNPKTTGYLAYDTTMLITATSSPNAPAQFRGAVSDGFPKPMPILFFVADLSDPDTNNNGAQFSGRAGMNNTFTSGETNGTFNGAYMNGHDLLPKVKDRFILIAPGLDRKYFGEDDVTN